MSGRGGATGSSAVACGCQREPQKIMEIAMPVHLTLDDAYRSMATMFLLERIGAATERSPEAGGK
jgi:hypothetical protein